MYRTLRLRALEADPQAFCSSVAREGAFAEAEWRRRVSSADAQVVVLNVGDALVGTAAGVDLRRAEPPRDAVEVAGVWVDPAHRGAGHATRLVDAVRHWALERGATTLRLEVAAQSPAVRVYERDGFSRVGEGRYPKPREHIRTLIMERPV